MESPSWSMRTRLVALVGAADSAEGVMRRRTRRAPRRARSAEEVLLVQRDRLERRDRGVLAIDGHCECLRIDLDLRRAAVADHVALADLARVAHRHHLARQAGLRGNAGG